MATPSSKRTGRRRLWRRPWPYVAIGVLLGIALGPAILFYQSLQGHGEMGFVFRPVEPGRHPDWPIVNLTREDAARLPGNIPEVLDRAKLVGSASVVVDEDERKELLRVFGFDASDPRWHNTLLLFEGTLFDWGLVGQ